jgi:hypothetical protein
MGEKTRTSSCFCGAVEVELAGEPAAQAYCHCSSCRGWLGAPIHAATLWPTPKVNVLRGADRLAVFKKTEASHRHFCTACGAPVLIRHPALGMTDVPAGSIAGFVFQPAIHVNYGEKVLAVRDGLQKFKDFPKDFGGSGEMLPE